MSLPNGHLGLAAVVLTRITAEEAEGPGHLTGRMTELIAELVRGSGPDTTMELAIGLARQHFILLDATALAINVPVEDLLAALELQQLVRFPDED